MPKAEKTPEYLLKPFRVCHLSSADCVAGFDDVDSATKDAEARTARAKQMGLTATYFASGPHHERQK